VPFFFFKDTSTHAHEEWRPQRPTSNTHRRKAAPAGELVGKVDSRALAQERGGADDGGVDTLGKAAEITPRPSFQLLAALIQRLC